MTKNTKNKTFTYGRKGYGDIEIVGFDEKKIKELSEKHPKIKTTIKKEFGKVSRYKREILRQRKQIKHHTDLLNKYLEKMEGEESRYLKMVNLLNPKVSLKRPTKSFQYWRGKVWWGVGRFKKRGWEEFHIISEKKRVRLGMSEDEVREMGKEKFRDKLILNDLNFD